MAMASGEMNRVVDARAAERSAARARAGKEGVE